MDGWSDHLSDKLLKERDSICDLNKSILPCLMIWLTWCPEVQ